MLKHKSYLLQLWMYFPDTFFFRMSARCLWDADTDNYAEDVFMNVSTPSDLINTIKVSLRMFLFFLNHVFLSHRTACSVWWQFLEAIITEDLKHGWQQILLYTELWNEHFWDGTLPALQLLESGNMSFLSFSEVWFSHILYRTFADVVII